MTDRIHRMAPCSQYDISGTQAWIEDMAQKGWFLEKDGVFLGLFSFQRGEPKTIRCRLEATTTNGGIFSDYREPDPEAEALTREMGWVWTGRRGQFHIYITDDPAAPELHTDPRVQAMTIRALTKFYHNALANSLISFLLYYILVFDFQLARFVVALGFWPFVFLAGLLLSVPLGHLRNVVRFYRLRRQLEQGDLPAPRSDYRKGRWFHYFKMPVLTLACVCLFFWIFCGRLSNPVPLEDWAEPLPFATTQDLFPEAEIDSSKDLLTGDFVNTFSDWFTPVNIEYDESADVTFPDGTTIWTDLHVLYHKTKYDWFAMQLAREHEMAVNGGVMDRLFSDQIQVTPLELDADYAVCWEDVYQYVLICQGNQVIRVSYNHEIAESYTPEELAQLVLDSLT